MLIKSERQLALFETTRRLVAQIANEGLGTPTLDPSATASQCHMVLSNPLSVDGKKIKCRIRDAAFLDVAEGKVISIVRPGDLIPPVLLQTENTESVEEWDPGNIFRFIGDWLPGGITQHAQETLIKELQNSVANQEKWLEIARKSPIPSLDSPFIAWERSIYFGHPTHPLHRTCLSRPPLIPVHPDDLPDITEPLICFVSVPRSKLRISGPFDRAIQPLLDKLGIPRSAERCTVPCFVRQLPSVLLHFPDAVQVKSVQLRAQAQASMRTVSLEPDLGFPYHLKLSLACQITSSLRTITPWTTALGPVLTNILKSVLPPDLWIFDEVAGVSGSQDNFDEARHLSCILRHDLQDRARENGEALVVAAALFERPIDDHRTYAEILFGLRSLEEIRTWFRRYISILFELILSPLVHYGIGLEAHGQNVVVRVCSRTKNIKGFAFRDFGGTRLHKPTLQTMHYDLSSIPSNGATITHDLKAVWNKVHHSLLQSHVGHSLHALGLETEAGWEIVREELSKALCSHARGRTIRDYFLRETMAFKCFIRMKLASKYRDYLERDVPNVALRP